MNSNLSLFLSQDEALVLFEVLARFQETDKLSLVNNAEFIALSRVSAQLDKLLVAPFDPNYLNLLAEARTRLSEGYEGQIKRDGGH